jgi:predicted nucleic acid-binding Zn finger protein
MSNGQVPGDALIVFGALAWKGQRYGTLHGYADDVLGIIEAVHGDTAAVSLRRVLDKGRRGQTAT